MSGRVCWAADVGRPLYGCTYLSGQGNVLAVCGKGPDLTLLDCSWPVSESGAASFLQAQEHPLVVNTTGLKYATIHHCPLPPHCPLALQRR